MTAIYFSGNVLRISMGFIAGKSSKYTNVFVGGNGAIISWDFVASPVRRILLYLFGGMLKNTLYRTV
jgi:hypothetical protein